MKTAIAGGPYKVPRQHDRWRAITLAVAMHAVLVLFLWVGVSWQNNEPVAVEAEIWSTKAESAAPPAPPAPPAPVVKETPREVSKPVTPPPPPPPAPAPKPVEAPAPKTPDIALERIKARLKEEKEKLEQQKQARLQKEAEKAAEKAADAKQARIDAKKAAEKKLAEQKLEEEKERKEQEKKDLAEQKLKDEQDKKEQIKKELAAKKAAAEKADKLAKDKADKLRAAEMSRITGTVGAGTSGTAEHSTGPRSDKAYEAAIQAKIKSNLVYGGNDDTLKATFVITQLPTGEIIGVRKTKGSGVAAYDSAIENAIAKSSPLPKKKDGTVVRDFTADFNMKDLH